MVEESSLAEDWVCWPLITWSFPEREHWLKRRKQGHHWNGSQSCLDPWLLRKVLWRPDLCSCEPFWNFRPTFPLLTGKLKAWGILYPQRHIPVARILGIFCVNKKWENSFSCLTGVSLSQSFTNTLPISTLESCKIIPVICLLNVGQVPPIGNSCVMPAVLPHCSMWAVLLSAAHVFRMTGFQAFRTNFLNSLVKGDSSHVLVDVCQSVALKQDEMMAPGMKTGSPWACPSWTAPLKPEAICHLLILFQHCPCHR